MSENKQYYYVYKLFNPDCEDFYIGSTVNMKARRRRHKDACNNHNNIRHNLRLYQYIRSNGGYQNWQYQTLEYIQNSINIKELHGVERKYIEELKPSLNCSIPNRTKAEYRIDKKDEIRAQQDKKHQCECGGKYTTAHRARHFKTMKHQNHIN